MKHTKILTIEDLKTKFEPIKNINNQHRKKMSLVDKLALWVTIRVGSMGFFFLIFCWTISWLSWNTIAPKQLRFDPYPAFVLWLFISNMLQIFLMPLIMVGQNIQSKHAEIRAEQDFLVNIKAEAGIEIILQHLENQQEIMLRILKKLEKEKEEN
ncbi:MAG: DUF1003 domain-containing protein, partial [Sediminibacterium sp.]|nr:DUF1003 domain-containing protein [Sediminibacterium sp.]